jgi:hypothetical protein
MFTGVNTLKYVMKLLHFSPRLELFSFLATEAIRSRQSGWHMSHEPQAVSHTQLIQHKSATLLP